MNNKCLGCGKEKNKNDFYQYEKPYGKKTYMMSYCKSCEGSRDKRNKRQHSKNVLKLQILNHYGSKCICCEESNILFLTIDHVNNDGNKMNYNERKNIHYWIKKNNYPKTLQILCWNCNQGKRFNNGVCPHKSLNVRT